MEHGLHPIHVSKQLKSLILSLHPKMKWFEVASRVYTKRRIYTNAVSFAVTSSATCFRFSGENNEQQQAWIWPVFKKKEWEKS